jgi:molybdopterin/thiamine biosynthesis adenylyltransferase
MAWDRVERVMGKEKFEKLGKARVAVVGLGSGGGLVAQTLAMSGVRNFVLVDDDALEEVNVVRHVCDRRYLGWNKARAVADLILQRNPDANIEVIEDRIERHMEALDDVDLLIVGVDNENTKYTLNAACLERNLTAVYAGVYELGEGGDVVTIHPGDGPCYACWASELREGLIQADAVSQDLDYGQVGPDGTLKAEPALWSNVIKIAAIQTDFALNELLARPAYPANTLIIANVPMEILADQVSPPHSTLWVNIPRDPACLVCGDEVNRTSEVAAVPVTLGQLAGGAGITIESDDDDSSADRAADQTQASESGAKPGQSSSASHP